MMHLGHHLEVPASIVGAGLTALAGVVTLTLEGIITLASAAGAEIEGLPTSVLYTAIGALFGSLVWTIKVIIVDRGAIAKVIEANTASNARVEKAMDNVETAMVNMPTAVGKAVENALNQSFIIDLRHSPTETLGAPPTADPPTRRRPR